MPLATSTVRGSNPAPAHSGGGEPLVCFATKAFTVAPRSGSGREVSARGPRRCSGLALASGRAPEFLQHLLKHYLGTDNLLVWQPSGIVAPIEGQLQVRQQIRGPGPVRSNQGPFPGS